MIVGGIAEEILYRGYAFGRLEARTGSPLLAAIVTQVTFAFAHIPLWGWRAAVAVGVGSTPLVIAFALTGDLWGNILAHVLADLVGIVLPLSRSRGGGHEGSCPP